MNRKNIFYYAQWWLFLILLKNIPVEMHSNNPKSKRIPAVSFKDNWYSIPRNFNRMIVFTKHMGKILEDMINMPRKNGIKSEIDHNVLLTIDYIFDGFDFIDNITKYKNNDLSNLMDKLMLTSKYNETIIEFFEILEDIERIFHNDFKNIEHYFDTDIIKLESFFHKTIENEHFRNKILLMDYCHLPNATDSFLAGGFDRSIFHMFFETLQQVFIPHQTCDVSMTNLIVDFYERILIDVIKGYTMMIISYEFYSKQYQGFDIATIQNENFNKYVMTTKRVIYSANELNLLITIQHKITTRCDPIFWEEGFNYFRVKNYVSDRSGFVAKNNNDYRLHSNIFQEYECEDIALYSNFVAESIDSMRCPEVFERYPQYCPSSISEEFTLPGIDYLNWNVTCYNEVSYSSIFREFCYCDVHSDTMLSIRTLSLREQLTDSNDNRVVTGIRFAVVNNVISLEIQEGKLVNGTIDPNSVQWVRQRGRDPKNGPATIKLGFTVKSFNLDDVELPSGHFVTGVKFKLLEDNHIGLVVRGTQMSDDIKLRSSLRHRWFHPIVSPRDPREKIYINDYRNSAEILTKNSEISHSGANYVDLSVGISSTIFNNLPVIPFLDSQNLESNPPSPLGGLGFFYKGQPGYGGFLAFKLISSLYRFDTHSDLIYFTDS